MKAKTKRLIGILAAAAVTVAVAILAYLAVLHSLFGHTFDNMDMTEAINDVRILDATDKMPAPQNGDQPSAAPLPSAPAGPSEGAR